MTNPTPDSGGTLNDLIKRWFEMEEEILQQVSGIKDKISNTV